MYLIWSTTMNGWLLNGAVFGSDRKEARQFQYDDAIAFCKRHYEPLGGNFGAVPVAIALLNSIVR